MDDEFDYYLTQRGWLRAETSMDDWVEEYRCRIVEGRGYWVADTIYLTFCEANPRHTSEERKALHSKYGKPLFDPSDRVCIKYEGSEYWH
jgi:hypothetical protein